MGNLTIAVIFVTILNVLMFLTQASMLQLNPEGLKFYNCEGTFLETYDVNKCSGTPVLDTSKISDELPTVDGSVSPTTGNLFTDTFTAIKNWFTTKINFVGQIVSAPYTMLKFAGVPETLRYAIGTLWYVISVFLIMAFFIGDR